MSCKGLATMNKGKAEVLLCAVGLFLRDLESPDDCTDPKFDADTWRAYVTRALTYPGVAAADGYTEAKARAEALGIGIA